MAQRPPQPRPAARDLERYTRLFAVRTRDMKSSAMRDLMAITERPEVISLAGGLPDTSTFPPDSYASLMATVARDSCARALQYGPTEGVGVLKDRIVEVMAAERTFVDPDDVLVTTGAQQAIDLMCKALIDPGDVIVTEAPTYPGAIPAFQAYQADVVQVEMDSDGLRIDELEVTLERLEGEGRRPKFLYTIPTFHNPAGVTMSLPRRRRLVEVARERELLVLEDNPYGLLRFEGEALPTLRALDGPSAAEGAGGLVVYLGTFSKILSPGIRLGWAVGPGPVLDKLRIGKASADLCSSSMTQYFVDAYFQAGRWEDYLGSLRELYRGRRDTMLEALTERLGPEASWTRPEGGLFVWVTLPDYIDTTDLLARALRENVAFVPGEAAYVDGRGRSSLRLNFSGVNEQDIREGVRRIGGVIREQVGLYGTLTGAQPPRAGPDAQAGARPGKGAAQTGAPAGAGDEGLADVVALPPRREGPHGRARGVHEDR
ncbi:MAG TPA: PLP-dependent aminotransferase family protein [Solirubrobacteraceae bacterium]|nr:PLP-dependent aminotransferase family protein [Solirubrobacteraceae bacterium]